VILLAVLVLGDCAAAVAVLSHCCCTSCVLHNGDADLRCNTRAGLIVAPMMQRNHRDLHLVLRLVFSSHRMALIFVRTGGRFAGRGVDVIVGVYAGWLRSSSAVRAGLSSRIPRAGPSAITSDINQALRRPARAKTKTVDRRESSR